MSVKEIELLAPAGTMEVLQSVVEAGADAVYLGGKRYNMRMLRTGYNFDNEEISAAVKYLHSQNRKLYVTVNNLYNNREINEINEYLLFLDQADVDGLIVQDLGMLKLCNELKIKTPIHASVQMGVSNRGTVKELENAGVSRVILSKNLSLEEIQHIHNTSNAGIEYFMHGDLCISHAGQCYMSSFAYGASGNRGECTKPCRWKYELAGDKDEQFMGQQYFLAHNDLCLYPYIGELIEAGVTSFKIEGRMRSGDYLAYIISTYRKAIDRILADPNSYEMDKDEYRRLNEKRVRDYGSASLFGRPDRSSIGFDGSREPAFPTKAAKIHTLKAEDYKSPSLSSIPTASPELSIRLSELRALEQMDVSGLDNIILSMDIMRQNQRSWNIKSVEEHFDLLKSKKLRLFIETPRIVCGDELDEVYKIKSLAEEGLVSGFIVNDLGSLNLLSDSGLEIWSGCGLNTINFKAAQFLGELGVKRISSSLEMDRKSLQDLLSSGVETEVMVHGPLCGIISDYCISRAVNGVDEDCGLVCTQSNYRLSDEFGQEYRIRTDLRCRNYVYYPYDLALFKQLADIISFGARSLRIDGQYYSPEKNEKLIAIYRRVTDRISRGEYNLEQDFVELLTMFPEGLSDLNFDDDK